MVGGKYIPSIRIRSSPDFSVPEACETTVISTCPLPTSHLRRETPSLQASLSLSSQDTTSNRCLRPHHCPYSHNYIILPTTQASFSKLFLSHTPHCEISQKPVILKTVCANYLSIRLSLPLQCEPLRIRRNVFLFFFFLTGLYHRMLNIVPCL